MKTNTLFLVFNHQLTDKQKDEARQLLNIGRCVSLPNEFQRYWSAVNPAAELDVAGLKRITKWLSSEAQKGDYVLVQGDFGATYYIVDFCFQYDLIPVYATTHRNTSERKNLQGQVEKISHFDHDTFRNYGRYHA